MTTAALSSLDELLSHHTGERLRIFFRGYVTRTNNITLEDLEEAKKCLALAFSGDVRVLLPALPFSSGIEKALRMILRDANHVRALRDATGYHIIMTPLLGDERGVYLKRMDPKVFESTD